MLLALFSSFPDSGCAGGPPATTAPVFGYRVVASFPHDPAAFTQGLVVVDGQLFEGTGNYGASTLRRVDLATGRVERETRLAPELFGEGIAQWHGWLVQLTWREGLGLIRDRDSLETRETFRYQGEGWGLTQDGRHWIMSDGTAELRFLDPESRRVVRRLTVRDGARSIRFLNELEYIAGEVWANVWHQDYLVRIDPDSGAVTGYLDLSGLYPESERPSREAVLNGIAHDAATDRLYVTGKYWPRLYQIEVVPR
ncbi:glutamine cyclotransferase [Thiocystis violascens DSM 198]|uniref:Glutamine cyclotransferase n=2 Tax=Thiocystis violascens TaxID=73141 RepID=I3YC32_THIV6|nr:glutamine cyclotransferase [Thiocystis violascens DSM 198]